MTEPTTVNYDVHTTRETETTFRGTLDQVLAALVAEHERVDEEGGEIVDLHIKPAGYYGGYAGRSWSVRYTERRHDQRSVTVQAPTPIDEDDYPF